MRKWIELYKGAVSKTWGVILFALICYMLFEQGMRKRNGDYDLLSQQLSVLQKEKQKALALQEDLLLQINSQSDPAWVELTLMKGLGMVPEGQTKYYFKSQP